MQFLRTRYPSLLIAAIVVACGTTVFVRLNQKRVEPKRVETPSDVEMVLKNYRYSQKLPEGELSVKGKELVRRGSLMLGLRCNVKKSTLLSEITGRLIVKRRLLEFSAAEGEWETSPDAPLMLQRDVSVRLAGVRLPDVERAVVEVKQGRVITFGAKRKVYYLK